MSTLANRLDEARAVVARLEREAASATCRELGRHTWVSIGGCNAGCGPDCGCSVPVLQCQICGDCDFIAGQILGKAWMSMAAFADAVLFIHGKVKFLRPDGSLGKSPANGTTLFASGPKAVHALARAAQNGLGYLAAPAALLALQENSNG